MQNRLNSLALVDNRSRTSTLNSKPSRKQVLRKIGTARKLILTVRKRWLKFLGHIGRKEGLENITLNGTLKTREARVNSNLLNSVYRTRTKRESKVTKIA